MHLFGYFCLSVFLPVVVDHYYCCCHYYWNGQHVIRSRCPIGCCVCCFVLAVPLLGSHFYDVFVTILAVVVVAFVVHNMLCRSLFIKKEKNRFFFSIDHHGIEWKAKNLQLNYNFVLLQMLDTVVDIGLAAAVQQLEQPDSGPAERLALVAVADERERNSSFAAPHQLMHQPVVVELPVMDLVVNILKLDLMAAV